MEKPILNTEQLEAEMDARMPQPSASKASAVMNGIGNGVTVGMATFAIPHGWKTLRGKAAGQANPKSIAMATVVGTLLGSWYGLHEAKQLGDYRDAIGGEIIKLRERVRQLEGKPPLTHAEKVVARREEPAHDELPGR